MGNTLLSESLIAMECLRLLENQTTILRDGPCFYEAMFRTRGARLGDVVNIRLPRPFFVPNWATGVPLPPSLDMLEEIVPVVLQARPFESMAWQADDLLKSLDLFAREHLRWPVDSLGAKVARLRPFGKLLLTADLHLRAGADMAIRVKDEARGLAIRLIRAYDPPSDEYLSHIDMIIGVEGGCVEGNARYGFEAPLISPRARRLVAALEKRWELLAKQLQKAQRQ